MSEHSNEPPRMPSNKWRRDFGNLLKIEREREPELARSDSLDEGYLTEIETFKSVPDLPYLFRLLMRFHERKKNLPSPLRFHRLLVLWILARVEAMYEQLGFREDVVSDYMKPVPPKKEGLTREQYRREMAQYQEEKKEYTEEKRKRPQKETYRSKAEFNEALSAYAKEVEDDFVPYWEDSGLPVERYFLEVLSPVEEKLREEIGRVENSRRQEGELPSLDLFPEKFERIAVVVGDFFGETLNRLPENISELFRKSQSFINLHHLLRLGLPRDTEILSDHLLLQLRDEERARELGDRHLLVVGSPAVNSVSRHLILNKSLIFNFVYKEKTYNLKKNFYDSINTAGLLETKPAVQVFYLMMETVGEINLDDQKFVDRGVNREDRKRLRDKVLQLRDDLGEMDANHDRVTELFTPKRMFSPFKPVLPDCSSGDEKESAVISLGLNPWSQLIKGGKQYAVIAVCGMNRVSTAKALKALSDKDNLRTHPLGGLLEVTKFPSVGPERVTKSTYEWLDEGYTAVALKAKIDEAAANFDASPLGFREYFLPEKSAPRVRPEGYTQGPIAPPRELIDYRQVVEQFTERSKR